MHTIPMHVVDKMDEISQDVFHTPANFVPSLPLAHKTHKCTTEAVVVWSIPCSLNDEKWLALQ